MSVPNLEDKESYMVYGKAYPGRTAEALDRENKGYAITQLLGSNTDTDFSREYTTDSIQRAKSAGLTDAQIQRAMQTPKSKDETQYYSSLPGVIDSILGTTNK